MGHLDHRQSTIHNLYTFINSLRDFGRGSVFYFDMTKCRTVDKFDVTD